MNTDNVAQVSQESVTENNNTTTPTTEQKWFHADGVEGTGAKPDWLQPKFQNVSEQAKAYRELEQHLSSTRPTMVAPEEYNIELSEDLQKKNYSLDKNSTLYKSMEKVAKEKGLPNNLFSDLVNNYLSYEHSALETYKNELDVKSESILSEFGIRNNLAATKEEMKKWLVNNTGLQYEKDIAEVISNPTALKTLIALKQKSSNGVPTPEMNRVVRDANYFMKLRADPRYITNSAFTRQVDAEFVEAVERNLV